MTDVGNTVKLGLFIALGLLSAIYIFWWARKVREQRAGAQQANEGEPASASTPARLAIGFGTNIFDTLGIGSFATTTAAFKLLRIVRDEDIPGTMIIGHTLPVIAQSFIFMTIVRIDPVMLVLMILASLIGGWLGAGELSDKDMERDYRRSYPDAESYWGVSENGLKVKNGHLEIEVLADGSHASPKYMVTLEYGLSGKSFRLIGKPQRRNSSQ